jgi:hypothetical protein
LLDALLQAEHKPVYVETDDSNPDVYKAVNELVTSELCNIDDESGWVKLGGIIEAHPKACIVVNTAARATDSIVEHGSILVDVATELSRDLVMVWPLNRQRDGLELLKNFLDAEQGYAATYALLNTYFGKEDKFVRYSSGKLKGRVTDTIVFPELNDLVADRINDSRLSLWNTGDGFSIAERSALSKYRHAVRVALEPICE